MDVSLKLASYFIFSQLTTATEPRAFLTQRCFQSEHLEMLMYRLNLRNLRRVRLKTAVYAECDVCM